MDELIKAFNHIIGATAIPARVELRSGDNEIIIDYTISQTAQITPAVTAEASVSVRTAEAAPKKGREVTSPIVGTYFSAASPDAEPFVKAGQAVKAGQTLCIVEAMKMLNEIEAPCDGVVLSVSAKNGGLVEYGQVLMVIG